MEDREITFDIVIEFADNDLETLKTAATILSLIGRNNFVMSRRIPKPLQKYLLSFLVNVNLLLDFIGFIKLDLDRFEEARREFRPLPIPYPPMIGNESDFEDRESASELIVNYDKQIIKHINKRIEKTVTYMQELKETFRRVVEEAQLFLEFIAIAKYFMPNEQRIKFEQELQEKENERKEFERQLKRKRED